MINKNLQILEKFNCPSQNLEYFFQGTSRNLNFNQTVNKKTKTLVLYIVLLIFVINLPEIIIITTLGIKSDNNPKWQTQTTGC